MADPKIPPPPPGFRVVPGDVPPPPPGFRVIGQTTTPKEPSWWDKALEFGAGAAKGLIVNTGANLLEMGKRVALPAEDTRGKVAQMVAGPAGPLVTDMALAQADQFKKAYDAARQGEMLEASGQFVAGLIPLVGPAIAAGAEKLGTAAGAGDAFTAGEAVGDLAGLAVAPERVAARIPTRLLPRPANAATAEAVAFGQRRGIPVDAATQTGSRTVQVAQKIADSTPIGSMVADKARRAQGEAFARVGAELADEISPRPVVPEQAGQGAIDTVRRRVQGFAGDARAAYEALREIEADPANLRTVQTGTKKVPSGNLDEGGNPVMVEVPVFEEMPLPVDLRAAKEQLRPFYNRLRRQLPVTQQRASPGMKAMENILEGPNFAPASIVDMDLGTIKGLARADDLPELRTLSQGVASAALKALDEAVTDAVGSAVQFADESPSMSRGVAQSVEGGPVQGPAPLMAAAEEAGPVRPPVGGVQTSVTVPGSPKEYAARYEVRELADVRASHSGENFQPNPRYTLKNDRDYTKPVNQRKVVENATPAKFDERYLVNTNPDAVNGPPILSQAGEALGGNGRLMTLERVYRSNPRGVERYRQSIEQQAQLFGIDPAQLQGMKQPVLVRVIDEPAAQSGRGAQAAVTDFNKTGTAELTPAERAIADSRRVSPEMLEEIGAKLENLGTNKTLADLMDAEGITMLQRLIDDGVISPQEQAAFMGDKGLTKAGRERINKLLLGRFFEDPAQLDSVPAVVQARLERVAGPLARVEGGEWSLTPFVQEAVGILESAKTSGIGDLEVFLNQGGLFGETQYSPRSVQLARTLSQRNMQEVQAAVRQYANDAEIAAKGPGLFGDPPSAAESFAAAFGGDVEAIANSGMPKPRARAEEAARPTSPRGAEGLQLLRDGRTATVAKYDAADVLKALRDEPVQAFNQLTWGNDAGIAQLREVAKLAPDEMPRIGRAYVENMLKEATAEGGFTREASMLRQWQNLGPETKKILFRDPMKIRDLDNFFLLAKKAAENPNPSGSGLIATSSGSVGYAFVNPATGIPMIIGAGALSKLLHSPKAVAALSKGLDPKFNTGLGRAATAANILKVAGDQAKPLDQEEKRR